MSQQDKDLNPEVEETKEAELEDVLAESSEGEQAQESEAQESADNSELDALKSENEALSDQVLRLQAEIQNLQRRNTRNREELLKFRSQDLAKSIIPSIDNLERALQIEVEDEAGIKFKEGVQMVLSGLVQGLSQNNVEVIDPKGEAFDPNFHEAYTQLPAQEGQSSGQVAEVFEKGYKLHDRVLRAAKVAVVQ